MPKRSRHWSAKPVLAGSSPAVTSIFSKSPVWSSVQPDSYDRIAAFQCIHLELKCAVPAYPNYFGGSRGRHRANQCSTSAYTNRVEPSLVGLRLRGRGQMPDAKSGRVHILRQLAVPSGVAAEDTGNHFLLSVTRRSERCRSGSEISRARLYERQGAERRSRSVEGCGIRDELNDRLLSINVTVKTVGS